MPIAFKCKCGRAMRVRDDNAGKRVRCPECGAGVRIPNPDPNTEDEIKALTDWAKDTTESQREIGRATPPPVNKTPAPKSRTSNPGATPLPQNKLKKPGKPDQGNVAAVYLAFASLGVVLLLAAVVWFTWLR